MAQIIPTDAPVPSFAVSIPPSLWEADERDDCLLYDGSIRLTKKGANLVSDGDFSEVAIITSGQSAVYELGKYDADIGNGRQRWYMLTMVFFAEAIFPPEDMLSKRFDAKLHENSVVYLFEEYELAAKAMQSAAFSHMSLHAETEI